MYQCIGTVFNPVVSARSMDLATQAKQMKTDPVTGDPYVELQSNTLLPCGFLEGGLLLWRVFASKNEQNLPGYVMKVSLPRIYFVVCASSNLSWH